MPLSLVTALTSTPVAEMVVCAGAPATEAPEGSDATLDGAEGLLARGRSYEYENEKSGSDDHTSLPSPRGLATIVLPSWYCTVEVKIRNGSLIPANEAG